MNLFWNLILVSFFVTNSLDKAESVQLEETPFKIFDEIFGEGWWDNEKDEEWHKLTLEQNALHQIDRQNTQLGQIEHNSIDQLGQIEPNSTDQNPPLTESDHSDTAKNGKEQNKIMQKITSNAEDERKRKIVDKFLAIKKDFKQKGKYSNKEWTQIEKKIAKDLKVNRSKIYKWKKEFDLTRRMHNFGNKKNDRKNLVEKFDQRKAELKWAGIKNSYPSQINETVAKELGLSFGTISNWKRKLGQSNPNHIYSDSEQKELMKSYYKIKDQNPKISDEQIAKKMLKIGSRTLCNWKKQFKRQQFYQNSVDGNVHEIGLNSGNI